MLKGANNRNFVVNCVFMGFILSYLLGCATVGVGACTSDKTDAELPTKSGEPLVMSVLLPPIEINTTTITTVEKKAQVAAEEAKWVTYRVTAYCACQKCCGEYALNRPTDANGEPIVYGASGAILVNGVSCAGTLPFGTKVQLENYGTVVVQDRFAKWIVEKHGNNIIDLYMTDHQAALNWGVRYVRGRIVE